MLCCAALGKSIMLDHVVGREERRGEETDGKGDGDRDGDSLGGDKPHTYTDLGDEGMTSRQPTTTPSPRLQHYYAVCATLDQEDYGDDDNDDDDDG